MESETNDSTSLKQLSGRKKKKLFTKLKEQMEFYFSDSNLARDNFLQDLIAKDPEGYVDLEVFKSFNKIKELTEDTALLSESLSKSSILEVNDIKTKVRRLTPLGEPKDFDACTIYVEKLPPNADIRWVKGLFERFGSVDYVNIPRFKHSNKMKGFAFVEFSCPEGVSRACEFYQNSANQLNAGTEEDSDYLKQDESDANPLNNDTDKNCRKRKAASDCDSTAEENGDNTMEHFSRRKSAKTQYSTSDAELPSGKLHGKRKHGQSDGERQTKMLKLSENEIEGETQSHKVENTVKHEENELTLNEKNSAKESLNAEDAVTEKSKRKRKHKKKRHVAAEQPLLRVMSKYEWKTYRNKYLDLQRSTMSHIKKHILLQSREQREQEMIAKSESVSESLKQGLRFQPGVILKVLLGSPIENAADIKEKIKANATVAYTDALLGHSEMFIRCHKTEDAQNILQEKKLDFLGSVEVLKGTVEENYWRKIEEDRKLKFSVPLTHKKRGRDKIIAKAAKLAEQKNKHIFFNE